MRNLLVVVASVALVAFSFSDASAQRQRGQKGGQRRQAQQNRVGGFANNNQPRPVSEGQERGGRGQCNQGQSESSQTGSAESLFVSFDQNLDGIISRTEARQVPAQIFAQVDANGDGGCDMSEFENAFQNQRRRNTQHSARGQQQQQGSIASQGNPRERGAANNGGQNRGRGNAQRTGGAQKTGGAQRTSRRR